MRYVLLTTALLFTTSAANAQNCVTISIGGGQYITECEKPKPGIAISPNGNPYLYVPGRPKPCLTTVLSDGTVVTQCE